MLKYFLVLQKHTITFIPNEFRRSNKDLPFKFTRTQAN